MFRKQNNNRFLRFTLYFLGGIVALIILTYVVLTIINLIEFIKA